ncbi:tetratricopeptide repeat protein [Streptomyces sp. NRRL S-146]|uniref:tetratricopeptide repeat protein n=1 Tax=Streptomyces sp. NRRL S-146 TaxID=1463884 RepID=UPI001F190C77|nr:tetratricopeptide repeat protein [Streptomyces sp. NRRL S-146]
MEYMEVDAYVVGMNYGAGFISSILGTAPGGVWKCRFVARIQSPDGTYEAMTADFVKFNSAPIEQLSRKDREEAQEQLNRIHESAVSHGFEPLPRGTFWYSYRYQRPYEPELSEAPTQTPSTDALLEEASALNRTGKHPEAVTLLTQILSQDPNYRRAYLRRGDTLMVSNRPSDAIKDYDRALSLSHTRKQRSQAFLGRAEAYQLLEDWRAALDDCQEVTPRDLTDSGRQSLWAAMGYCHFRLGKYREAVSFFDRAVKIDPEECLLRVNRSAAYYQLGKYKDALRDCEYVLKKEPGNESAKTVLRAVRSKVSG